MHIAIDARAYAWTGIGRYIVSLVRGIAKTQTEHSFSLLLPADKISKAESQFGIRDSNRFTVVGVEPSYYSWREQTIFLRQLTQLKADLTHFTHFNVPLLFRAPYVVTIHDITRFIFPGQKKQKLSQQIAYELVFSQAVRNAKSIICVTEHTRKELESLPLKVFGKLKVIYEGIDQDFFNLPPQMDQQKARMLIGTSEPYLLYVGVWMAHKNIHRLLQAFKILKEKNSNLKLVITGRPVPGYSNVMHYVRDLGLTNDVIFCGYVPHKLLSALYQQASCFVFPSLYEGFGLPPLEAAATGTPVVTSNVSSLPEVMGHAAKYVNPEDTTDITDGIEQVLNNKLLRDQLVEAGRLQAKKFTWEKCVEETLQVYDEL